MENLITPEFIEDISYTMGIVRYVSYLIIAFVFAFVLAAIKAKPWKDFWAP